jgi:hypothetical protein
MKGFLIFMVLLVGGSIYLLVNSQQLCRNAIEAVDKDEGPNDQAFQDQLYADPPKFAEAHRLFLQRRMTIAKVLTILGEQDLMVEMVNNVRARYDQSALDTDPDYGELVYREAAALEDGMNSTQGAQANELCKRYLALFPDGKRAVEASAMIQRLAYKYNFR